VGKGKVAIVTGASRGIGRAIALSLAMVGVSVVVNYKKSRHEAEKVLELVQQAGSDGFLYEGSVADSEAMERMVAATLEQYGQLDILINNAGILVPKHIMMTKAEEWIQAIETNLTGAFYCVKYAIRPMIEQHYGRIVNVSSVASIRGIAGQGSYASSKAGLNGLTRVLAKELALYGITVNAVAPGFIETDMTSIFDKKKTEYQNTIPLKEFGKPEDVASLVSFLVSDNAGYITGQVIAVDGGLSI